MKISELLDSPKKWTQRFYARDSEGLAVSASSTSATCWCLRGAAMRLGFCSHELECKIESKIKQLFPGRWHDLVSFNDDYATKYEDVIAVLKECSL